MVNSSNLMYGALAMDVCVAKYEVILVVLSHFQLRRLQTVFFTLCCSEEPAASNDMATFTIIVIAKLRDEQ